MSKLEKIRESMRLGGFDAVIVLDELNQHYLSDFAFTDGFLLISLKSAYLVTDFRYFEMAQKSASTEFEILMPADRRAFINEALSADGVKTIGFEGGSVSYATQRRYAENHPAFTFVDIGSMIEELRQVKTPDEIEKMQKAQDITDKAFSHILGVLSTDMTELDVAVELEYTMRKLGASGFAFDTIAVSGDGSALPHGTPRNVKLKPGFLTMDFGAKYQGYCSDMTRTVIIGRATEELRSVYNTVLSAQLAALDFLRAGVDCADADKCARDIIDAKYAGTFGHSLGHSVGLFVHESPALSKKSAGRALRPGEIVTVEPGIYLPGKYGCRIEDMVKIEENGIYNFTHSTKELIEIT